MAYPGLIRREASQCRRSRSVVEGSSSWDVVEVAMLISLVLSHDLYLLLYVHA